MNDIILNLQIFINELSRVSIVGYNGNLSWDNSKPDGTPQKLLDVSKLHHLGWKHKIDLETGIKMTYEWFKNKYGNYNQA